MKHYKARSETTTDLQSDTVRVIEKNYYPVGKHLRVLLISSD